MFFYTIILGVVVWLLWNSFKDRKPDEPKNIVEKKSLSSVEQFALDIGNLEFERLSQRCKELNLHDCLEKSWGIRFDNEFAKDRMIYTLQKILTQGSVGLLLKNRALQKEVRVKDMVAFDSSCFVELVRQAMALKLLSQEEAWGFLFLNAQRVQDSFEGWEDFKSSYLRGANLVTMTTKDEKAYTSTEVKIVWLKEDVFNHLKIENKE